MYNHELTEEYKKTYRENERAHDVSEVALKYLSCDPEDPDICIPHYATGYPQMDQKLNGGFTPGLHCLGAIASLGKSTWTQQMAEQMSAMGTPVIIYSLEMPIDAITTKAISRHTFMDDDARLAHRQKTSDDIVNVNCRRAFDKFEWSVIKKAAVSVSDLSTNLRVFDSGTGSWTIDRIGKHVQDWILIHQKKPVVIIDYLQIIAPPDRLATCSDKQLVDYSIHRLKVLSDYFGITIILISNLNRDSYDNPVDFKAFKESGSIEYSCDTVLGMQLSGAGEAGFNSAEAKARSPRSVEINILKQRYGRIGQRVCYEYFCDYNYFNELPDDKDKSKKMPEKNVIKFN